MHLLRHYERVFLSTRVNNCVWPVLVRTVGAGHAVLQALWHGDIVRIEAEEAMGKVMWLLDKLSTRWTVAAAAACANFTALCTALGASRTLSLSRSKTRAVSCRSLFHHADTSCTVSLPQRSTPRPA